MGIGRTVSTLQVDILTTCELEEIARPVSLHVCQHERARAGCCVVTSPGGAHDGRPDDAGDLGSVGVLDEVSVLEMLAGRIHPALRKRQFISLDQTDHQRRPWLEPERRGRSHHDSISGCQKTIRQHLEIPDTRRR
ncbi:MAG TPA: hypothetical protein PLC40_08770, partial [Candidatus Hydrogenedentes bacterium]|nr:hypothetical protein [Candidatus Hydrogenedentota bacterium]